jgi:hypothetical protein
LLSGEEGKCESMRLGLSAIGIDIGRRAAAACNGSWFIRAYCCSTLRCNSTLPSITRTWKEEGGLQPVKLLDAASNFVKPVSVGISLRVE